MQTLIFSFEKQQPKVTQKCKTYILKYEFKYLKNAYEGVYFLQK